MATNQMRREAAKRKLERQQERRAEQQRKRQRVAVITSVAVVVLVVAAILALTTLTGGGSDQAAAPPDEAPSAVTPDAIPTEIAPLPVRSTPLPDPTTCEYAPSGDTATAAAPPDGAAVSSAGTVPVTMQTSAGPIGLSLDRALAPCTVNSFVSLAGQGFFDGSPCHRLTTTPELQVLQCGDPTGSGSGGPGYTVPDEVFDGLTYGRGILAMANSGSPNTGGSQFFIVYGDAQLPPQYTAFGSITPEGLAVVDEIARAGHDGSFDAQAGGGAPITPVTVESVQVG